MITSLRREYHAIESEFLKDKLESVRRVWRLIKELCNPKHPFHQLSPGNLATLQHLQNETAIQSFHSKFYTPENMKCVVYGREVQQDLIEMARLHFGKIKAKHSTVFRHHVVTEPKVYTPGNLYKWVDYQPLREGAQLDVIWPLFGASRCGVGSVIRILNQPHSGSALSVLKKRGLATALSWSLIISTTTFSILRLNVKLTELGKEDIWGVAKVVFNQLEILKIDHMSTLRTRLLSIHHESLRSFINKEREPAHHFVKSLSTRMSKVLHPAYYLGPPLQPTSTSCFLQTLSSLEANQSIFLFGVHLQSYPHTEPWYKIPYNAYHLYPIQLYDLSIPNHRDPDIYLPPLERYPVTRTLPLFDRDLEQSPWPSIVHQTPGLSVWWQQDSTFHLPKTDIILWVYTAHEHRTPRDVALHYLLVEMARDQLQDKLLPAGFKIELFYQGSSGFVVTMSGYSDHDQVTRSIKELMEVLTKMELSQEERFKWVVRYQAHQEISRSDYAEAYKHPLYKSRWVYYCSFAKLLSHH